MPHLEKFSMATFSNLTILFLKTVKKNPFKFVSFNLNALCMLLLS